MENGLFLIADRLDRAADRFQYTGNTEMEQRCREGATRVRGGMAESDAWELAQELLPAEHETINSLFALAAAGEYDQPTGPANQVGPLQPNQDPFPKGPPPDAPSSPLKGPEQPAPGVDHVSVKPTGSVNPPSIGVKVEIPFPGTVPKPPPEKPDDK